MTSPKLSLQALIERNHGTWRGWVRYVLGELECLSGRLNAHLVPPPAQVQRLVFVCLGNINRSAFAHAVAQRAGLHCASLGLSTTTGAPAYPMAIATAQRLGYDLNAHRATDLSDYSYQAGDYLLVMEVRHLHRLIRHGIAPEHIGFLGHWAHPHRIHLHDPHTLSMDYFQTCFAHLHSAVLQLAHHLRQGASPACRP